MASWMSTAIQKRLLRYALSYLDILETDALDLDRLAIAWGKRSTVELRDIGLKVDRLTALLHLPPGIKLQHARILLLRVTIPADIYASGIKFEIEGVEAVVCLERVEANTGDVEAEALPSRRDVAKSFLAHEPLQEKLELESALHAHAGEVDASMVASELDDGEPDLGTGTSLSLPLFLAGFLKGITDRLEVTISNINVQVDAEVGLEQERPEESRISGPISLSFHARKIAIGGLTVEVPLAFALSPDDTKPGRRQVSVTEIYGSLMSSRGFLSEVSKKYDLQPLDRTTTPGSPNERHRHVSSQNARKPASCQDDSRLYSSLARESSSSSSELASRSGRNPMASDLNSSALTEDHDRFADAPDPYLSKSAVSSAPSAAGMASFQQMSDSIDPDDLLSADIQPSDLFDSRFLDDDLISSDIDDSIPYFRQGSSNPAVARNQPLSSTLPNPGYRSQVAPGRPLSASDRGPISTSNEPPLPSQKIITDAPDSGSSSDTCDDLSESKLYTHEEAQSMYMSAMSGIDETSGSAPLPVGRDSDMPDKQTRELDSTLTSSATVSTSAAEAEDGCATPRPGSSSSQFLAAVSLSGTSVPAEDLAPDQAGKCLFAIDQAHIWLPDSSQRKPAPYPQMSVDLAESSASFADRSSHPDVPGSFSFAQYAEASAMRTNSRPFSPQSPKRVATEDMASESPVSGQHEHQDLYGVDVAIGTLQSFIDASSGWLLSQICQQLLATLALQSGTDAKDTKLEETSTSYLHKFSIAGLSIAFVDRLTFLPPAQTRVEAINSMLDSGDAEVVFKTSFKGFQMKGKTSTRESSFSASVQSFDFGLSDEHILSFLPAKEQQGKARPDISLTYSYVDYQSRLRIDTLPLGVRVNIQKLDDTLARFGGVSGMLELGSSIASTGTINPSSPKVQQRRTIRFESPPPVEKPPDISSSLKIDVRLAGVSLLVKGNSQSMTLDASPLRLAWRDQNLRMAIDRSTFTGPYLGDGQDSSNVSLTTSGIKVTFLFVPQENDLARLLSLITPSKDKYENDDDILVETLLRQRRNGSVLDVYVSEAYLRVASPAAKDELASFGAELSRLSTVTKYLPDDDRPGIMTFLAVDSFESRVALPKFGDVDVDCRSLQMVHIGIPALMAGEFKALKVRWGKDELICPVIEYDETESTVPMMKARLIGDEMVPTLRVKLSNICIEYQMSVLMAAIGPDELDIQDAAANLAESVATIMGHQPSSPRTQRSFDASTSHTNQKQLQINAQLKDCALGLNPPKSAAKVLFVMADVHLNGSLPTTVDLIASAELRRAFLLVIDDHDSFALQTGPVASGYSALGSRQVVDLCRGGYAPIGEIKSAKASMKVKDLAGSDSHNVTIDLSNALIVLEACADSFKTLIDVVEGLQPPKRPRSKNMYRTNMSVNNMMNSFSGNAFEVPQKASGLDGDNIDMDESDMIEDDLPSNLEFVGSIYNPDTDPSEEDLADGLLEGDLSGLARPPSTKKSGARNVLESFQEQYEVQEGADPIQFQDNYFGANAKVADRVHKWDSARQDYDDFADFDLTKCPLKVTVRDVHVIFNMFDGYDWAKTRNEVMAAVDRIQSEADKKRRGTAELDEDEPVVADFLFNSIWIEIPSGGNVNDLKRQINRDLDEQYTESESVATTTVSKTSANAATKIKSREKGYRLGRGKHQKMQIELSGVAADIAVFLPNSGETQSSIDVRVTDLDVYDHVPSSTWRKFCTYMKDAGERETDKPMLHLELLTVKPVSDLDASELVLKVTVLPLRLHVDQDALDFTTRFFEFSNKSSADETTPTSSTVAPVDEPFLQRVEINTVHLMLDYKPKKVDYTGLRSGHTTEFMNFFILDRASITLRHAILYGIAGLPRLHKTLNDVWMPDVRSNQLGNVVAGLSTVRPLVNVGEGVKDLVMVPMREYRKDGRIVRAIQKGTFAFATKTTSELARLGAKVAMGTQNMLQGAEDFVSPTASSSRSASHGTGEDWDDVAAADAGPDERRAHSNYAEQPLTVFAGLRTAAKGLERDLLTTRDAIIAVGGSVRESDNPTDAMKAMAKGAPTIVLKPMIGASKALGTALLGAGNQLDLESERRITEKYKRY